MLRRCNMKLKYDNGYGVQVGWFKKGEDWPGTQYITGKQGFWMYVKEHRFWLYLGTSLKLDDVCYIYSENFL